MNIVPTFQCNILMAIARTEIMSPYLVLVTIIFTKIADEIKEFCTILVSFIPLKVCKAISMYEDLFELMHFSDQYVGQKKEEM